MIQLSNEHITVLERYDWPGNIRQLRNVIEYLVVCGDDDYLNNINPLLRILGVDGYSSANNILPTLDESICSYEKGLIAQAVNKTGGIRKAAKLLGCDPATVSRKMKKYGIPLANGAERTDM
jgi:DNA-binding NtrC family response regulator